MRWIHIIIKTTLMRGMGECQAFWVEIGRLLIPGAILLEMRHEEGWNAFFDHYMPFNNSFKACSSSADKVTPLPILL